MVKLLLPFLLEINQLLAGNIFAGSGGKNFLLACLIKTD